VSRSGSFLAIVVVLLVASCHKHGTAPDGRAEGGCLPPEPPPVPPIAGVAPSCTGRVIDIAASAASDACFTNEDARTVPSDAVSLQLEWPEVTATSGGQVDLRVAIHNATDAPIALDLPLHCDPVMGFRATVLRDGVPFPVPLGDAIAVEGMERWCDHTVRCAGRVLRLGLAPYGAAFLRTSIHARGRGLDDTCEDVGTDPLPPGTYDLDVSIPFANGARLARGRIIVLPP
jgi:hypothetical protein